MVDFSLEAEHAGYVCGVDEAGRGPWAGPVVAAAAFWPERDYIPKGLDDSKKLSAKKRDALFDEIRKHCLYGIGQATVEEIDTLNILAATKLAMQRAVEALPMPVNVALIDGNQPPELYCRTESVIKGDGISASIAAASIVAKVTRDRIMAILDRAYPQYGWAGNAGYGTAQHQQAIAEHGINEHHRKSFAPIRKQMEIVA